MKLARARAFTFMVSACGSSNKEPATPGHHDEHHDSSGPTASQDPNVKKPGEAKPGEPKPKDELKDLGLDLDLDELLPE
jgi:hypothetical protein